MENKQIDINIKDIIRLKYNSEMIIILCDFILKKYEENGEKNERNGKSD